MKLCRFGPAGRERPGIVDSSGGIRDISSLIDDVRGEYLSPSSLRSLSIQDHNSLPIVPSSVRLGPCVNNVGKFICIGLNYADHARESGQDIPLEPVVFSKATSALSGPNDPIIQPKGSTKLDWEVELGIIVGSEAKYVSEENALNHVAGYCVINDVSERAFQMDRGGTWDKGKGADTFGPIGPWLVTADEVLDVNNLDMWLDVNGHPYQRGSTKNMIFGPAFLLSYVSNFMSLQPGDIISTGTPAGVGMGQTPPRYLLPGDVVDLGISKLGVQRQSVRAFSED